MTASELDKNIINAFRNKDIWSQMNPGERGTWAAINGIYIRHKFISKKNLKKLQGILLSMQFRQTEQAEITTA